MPKQLPCYLIYKKIDLYNGFGATEVFFRMKGPEAFGEEIAINDNPLFPLKIYRTNSVKINQQFNCKYKLP